MLWHFRECLRSELWLTVPSHTHSVGVALSLVEMCSWLLCGSRFSHIVSHEAADCATSAFVDRCSLSCDNLVVMPSHRCVQPFTDRQTFALAVTSCILYFRHFVYSPTRTGCCVSCFFLQAGRWLVWSETISRHDAMCSAVKCRWVATWTCYLVTLENNVQKLNDD